MDVNLKINLFFFLSDKPIEISVSGYGGKFAFLHFEISTFEKAHIAILII